MRPRVKLFSLPPWILSCPPISLPILAAACRARGIELRCCDGNLLFYEYLLRPEFLRVCVERLRPAALAADGQRELLLRTRLAVAERTLPSLPGLHRQIRQTDPEDPARWSYLLNTLDTLFQLASSATGVRVDRDTLQLPLEAETLGELVEHACSEPWPLVDGFLEGELLPRVDGSETAVGLSVHTQEHMYVAARFAALLKRHFPAVPVVAGGTFLTTYAARWRQFGAAFRVFDYVVVNDGEEALPALLHALAAGSRDPGDVPNLVWRSGGALRANPPRFVALADHPEPPDYTDLDLGQYHSPKPLASIPIARGCFYDCAYCNYPSVGGQRFRVDPARSVVEKVAQLSERYGVDSFFFSVAVLPPPLARRLAEALLERGVQVRWATGARFERGFTPDLCALLERSGCTRIDFGAESGDAGVLERMHKRLSIEDYRCALENFADTGINRHFYMIMNFPGETLEEFGSSVEFVQRAAPQLCSFNFFSYQLAPGSPVHADPAKYGVAISGARPDRDDLAIRERHVDPVCTPEATAAKLERLDGLAEALGQTYDRSGTGFYNRRFVPEAALQLTLPRNGALAPPPAGAGEPGGWSVGPQVELLDLGRGEVEGTAPARYCLVRNARTGRSLTVSRATLEYLLGRADGPVAGAPLVQSRDEPAWHGIVELFRANDLLEPAA